MEKLNLLTTKLAATPRIVWLVALLSFMALALAAGAADGMGCAGIPGC